MKQFIGLVLFYGLVAGWIYGGYHARTEHGKAKGALASFVPPYAWYMSAERLFAEHRPPPESAPLIEVTAEQAKRLGLPQPGPEDVVVATLAIVSQSERQQTGDLARMKEMFRQNLKDGTWDRATAERAGSLYVIMMQSSLDDLASFATSQANGGSEPFRASDRTIMLEKRLHEIPGARRFMQKDGIMSIAENHAGLARIHFDLDKATRVRAMAKDVKARLDEQYLSMFDSAVDTSVGR